MRNTSSHDYGQAGEERRKVETGLCGLGLMSQARGWRRRLPDRRGQVSLLGKYFGVCHKLGHNELRSCYYKFIVMTKTDLGSCLAESWVQRHSLSVLVRLWFGATLWPLSAPAELLTANYLGPCSCWDPPNSSTVLGLFLAPI